MLQDNGFIKDKRLFLLDIDGTVCIGQRLIDGTREFLKAVKNSGGQFVFITNNSTRSIEDYILSFQKLGVMTDYTNFITASFATVQYLKKHYEGKLIYVMGTKSLMRELKRNGIRVTVDCQDPEIACVLVSYDNQLTYEKIMDTCQILSTREVGYIATNLDYVCPIEFGYVPDCGLSERKDADRGGPPVYRYSLRIQCRGGDGSCSYRGSYKRRSGKISIRSGLYICISGRIVSEMDGSVGEKRKMSFFSCFAV